MSKLSHSLPRSDGVGDAAGTAALALARTVGELDRAKTVRFLAQVVGLLAVGHVVFVLGAHVAGLRPDGLGWQLLNLRIESAPGTWFTLVVYATVIGAAAVAAILDRGHRRGWSTLVWVLTAMSFDEVATIHERFQAVAQEHVRSSGLLHYIWVVPAVAVALGCALVVTLRLGDLPANVMRGLALSAVLFVGSAAGLEMVEGVLAKNDQGSAMALLTGLQEIGEMSALVLALWVVLGHVHHAAARSLSGASAV
jgi:hypothetical protein